jgi:hypothetical protein
MGGRFGSTGLHKQSPRPLADFLRLRVLEQAASPHELEGAGDTAAAHGGNASESADLQHRLV